MSYTQSQNTEKKETTKMVTKLYIKNLNITLRR